MKTKLFTILLCSLLSISVFSQANLNQYKYVIVPNKYDFLKQKDQYQLNSFTEFLFNKYGFTVLMEGSNYPEDLIRNRCLALKSNLLKDSSLFKTKLAVELKDCNDAAVFTSSYGESREKEYKKAYMEALRNAFVDIEALHYKFDASKETLQTQDASSISQTSTNQDQEILQLKEEIKTLKAEKTTQVATTSVTPVVSTAAVVKVESKPEAPKTITASGVLYAQAINNGYQLVDSTPKVVYKIKKTGQTNLYLVEGENAVIYKKEGKWIYERNADNGVQQKELNIKF